MSNLLNEINKHIFHMLGMPKVFQSSKTQHALKLDADTEIKTVPIYGFNILKFSFLFANTTTTDQEFRLIIKYDDFVSGIICAKSEGFTYEAYRFTGGWLDSDLLSQTTLLHALLQLENTVFAVSELDEKIIPLMKSFVENC